MIVCKILGEDIFHKSQASVSLKVLIKFSLNLNPHEVHEILFKL